MKNKPTRHKGGNTFKFLPFAERISNIDVDVFHRVSHKYEEDSEDNVTHFQQSLDKWNVLNLTESFDNLRKELPFVQTLPQLLNKKEEVVLILSNNIHQDNSLSLQPTLELVVALARDLRQEFYPFYPDLLRLLIDLLKTKDTDQLEWTFTCLAYLFKFLWRCLVKDLDIVFDSLLPLLAANKPSYINNFAAESFAFVARKVKDKKSFLCLILETLKARPDSVAGCGRLLFEVIRGVSGQFHSSAEVILPLYLNSLADETLSQELLFELLTNTFDALLTSIRPQKCALLWSSILQTVSVFASSWDEDRSERNSINLCLALKFLQQAANYKDSLLLAEPVPVARQLVELLRLNGLPEEVVSVTSEIGASLLLSSNAHLPQEHANNVMLRLLAVPHPAILIDFVVKVFDYSGFEALVLPHLLGHCHKQATVGITEDTIHLLTRLVIHKAEPSKTGMDLQNWHRYSLDFPSSSISEVLLNTLSVCNVEELLCRTDSVVCSFILLPHLKPLDNKAAVDKLKNIVHLLCDELKIEASSKDVNIKGGDKDESSKKRTKCILFMLVNAIEATIHLIDRESLVQFCEFNMFVDALLPYASNPQYSGALLALDLYLTAYKLEAVEEESCVEILEKLNGPLAKNLSSPFHNVRLLTCHLFSLLEQKPSDSENLTQLSLFGLCLAAERVPATIHEYRDRLQHLQNLEHGSAALAPTKGGPYNKTPLRYLMGTLYVNFQLLWEPVSVLIASHAHGMLKHEFWEVFVEQLHTAVEQVNANRNDSCELDTTFDLICPFLTQLYTSMFYFDDRPDYVNYRILLWKSMSHFPDICATRTRDVSTLFLTFLNDEYYKSNAGIANSWNVKLNDVEEADDLDESEAMEVEGANEDAELEVIKKKLLRKPPKVAHKLGTRTGKTCVAHLGIFSKFKDPKSVYKEPELKKVYYDFLSNKNPEIQRLALDCLMTYKHKFMLPYRENLYSLMDDRTFKAELAMFRVDKESELIQAGHREDLMPIIMRIAYSKMVTKAGSQRGGMAAGQIRRSIVLRFLAGCHEEELMLFVEMAFKIYTSHIQDDIVAMVDSIMDTIDLEKVIPPKRLQSSMNLLGVILTQFGGLMGQRLLPYLLRILLCVSANVAGMMRNRELVHPGYLATLRTVRSLCLETGANFFDRFNKFDWSSSDIDAVFNVMVFPWLDKLTVEGIHSPTALLKLFLVWSQHPRYFVLLSKHAPSDTSLAPLPHIMQLLQGEKTHPSVVNAILELVERLLTLSDFTGANEEEDDDSEMAQPLTVTSIIPVDASAISKLALSENINYGSALMLSHISAVLDRLKRKLSIKNKSLNRLELVILSRVSELVWDSETSDLLLRLLLPMLMKKCSAGDDVVIPLLTTLSNLIKNLADPEKYIRGLAPLFGQVCGAEPRRMLSQLMDTIASRCSVDKRDTLVTSLGIVGELNAWDRKWIDQPDFNRRLDAFKRINEMVDSRSVDFDLGLIVIHTCFHYLKVEKDLSLRDSAGYCLKRVAPALCLQYGDDNAMKDLLINQTVLILVRQGIRDKSDSTYNDVIGLLGAMARECGESHPVLRDLSALTNTEDPEVDFFENLQHLQGHRKARALLKFCQVAKTLRKAPNPRTLTQFILPIASTFLLSEKHAVKHSIVDAAIETVGTVCRLLPWHQYNLILRYYLDKLRTVLEYQKQLVRIVVAILDAFHFDLSRAKLVREVETIINNETLQSAVETVDETSSVLPMETDATKADPLPAMEDILDLDKEVDNGLSEELDGELAGEEEEAIVTDKLAFESQSVLSPSAALRATRGISNNLLPQLHTCIAQRSHVDTKHKLNRRQGGDDRDEEDVLRVPIAFAAVKLLQQLPKEMLDRNLPGIFMKLCTFLKSRLESVRRVTRQTLQKIMISLRPGYLSYLVSEMCALLTRGFQVHVLVYTIHSVMVSLKELFQPGDVDSCLKDVLDCCKIDLFGATAEEKKVAGIIGKVQEARSTKSYDTFQILAQFITEKCFTDLLLPIQNILDKSNSFKMINKAAECLRNVVIGLAANKFVPVESLLIFMYGTISESIPELVGNVKEPVTPAKREQIARQRPDTFIIPKAPRSRYGTITAVSKTAYKTNAHILVEFGLKLFHTLLKREKVRSSEYRQFIDPVVPIISDCLDAKHIKLSTLSLQCLASLFKMELPTMTENVSKIVSSLFKILHKYAAAGLSKGDNFDLVAAAFKAVVILVRDVKWHTIDADQLKALLLYAEQDVHDVGRQATAFALLKAILARKLVVPEVHDVMARVARMSVTSESANVRVQGRQVFHQYLMDYPLGNKVDEHLAFFLAQLDYELQTGRESALEMLHTVIATFPIKMLSKQSGLLFLSLGARLVNDDVPQCRKMVAQCLQTMIGRLEHSDRDKLFDIAALWLNDKKVGHRRLAAQLCGLFVLVEKADFEKRLSALLPAVVSQFGRGHDDGRPGQYVRLPTGSGDGCEAAADDGVERLGDHHMFQVLQLVLKLCEHCPRFLHSPEWQDYVNIVAENVQSMLAHPHEWVRLASTQYLGHLFASLSPELVAGYAGRATPAASRKKANKRGYLATNATRKLKSLVLDLGAQLHPEVTPQLADQVVKNLVFLGRVLKSVPKRESKVESIADQVDSDDEQEDSTDVSLVWMVRRMRKIVNTEVVQFPKSTIMRTSVFKWIGAMVLDLSKEATLPLLHHLLAPLVREMTSEDDAHPDMHRLAIDVSKVMKNKVGMDEYTRHMSVLETRINTRRAERKKARTREAITQPEVFAKRRIEKQLVNVDDKVSVVQVSRHPVNPYIIFRFMHGLFLSSVFCSVNLQVIKAHSSYSRLNI